MIELASFLPGSSPFDEMRHTRQDGSEYWSARDLQPRLGYGKWDRFVDTIERAKLAALNSGVDVESAFVQVVKLTGAGKLGDQRRYDFELSRFACYLTAMNGDPRKPEIAAAQAYFAVRTREAETSQTVALTGEAVKIEMTINALAELAHREHVVPTAARILAFQRWRKPRRGIETFVQLTIDLNLPGSEGGTMTIAAERKAIEGGGGR